MMGSFSFKLERDPANEFMWLLKIETGESSHEFKLYNNEVKEIERQIYVFRATKLLEKKLGAPND